MTTTIIDFRSYSYNDMTEKWLNQGGDNKQVERKMNGISGMTPVIPGQEKPSTPQSRGAVKGG